MLKDIPEEIRNTIMAEIKTTKEALGKDASRKNLRQKVKAILDKYGVKKNKN